MDLLSHVEAERHIDGYSTACNTMDADSIALVLHQAESWNRELANGGRGNPRTWRYDRQLAMPGETAMGYLDIPKLNLALPIFHGTGEDVLMEGIGHWSQSSLPIGGQSTHCVLMGHSGLRSARMFDGIRALSKGDRFIIWSLGIPHVYEVQSTSAVLPGDVAQEIGIEQDADLATLVTCTPYGVNSHRLLVRGQRCAVDSPQHGHRVTGEESHAVRTVLLPATLLPLLAWVIHRTRMKREQGHSAQIGA